MTRKKLKIAEIAPIVERVPPVRYGGTERMISELTEQLVRRGHDVTLFASGNSVTSARLVSAYPKNLREAKVKNLYGFNDWTILNIGLAYKSHKNFDVIHDHMGHCSAPIANVISTPVIQTMHGPITPEARRVYRELSKPHLVTISRAQMTAAPELNYIKTIHHGLNMRNYPFSDQPEPYLLYVGRLSMEKGVHHAIQAALNVNLPLVIAAKLDDVDRPYFSQYIEPYLSDDIRWIGEVTQAERNELMSKALCFLHATMWSEPFGLSLIEAMGCGCPVIAFARGSIPEIIQNGKTGFVVDDLEGMIEAIYEIGKIDRRYCREYALKKFTVERMADQYEEVFYEALAKTGKPKTASNDREAAFMRRYNFR